MNYLCFFLLFFIKFFLVVHGQSECIVCDESQDPDCRLLATAHEAQLCPPESDVTTNGCYRYEANNNVIRGCVSSLVGTPLLEECETGVTCKICEENGCNSKVDFQRCYDCNSGTENDCLRVQNGTRPNRICDDYMDSCVQIIEDQTRLTIRGCTNEVDASHTPLSNMRLACTANFCNNNIYPIWRATCHQCDSGEECNRNSTETFEYLMPCKIFFQDDYCYSVLRDRQAVRGCISDADVNVDLCQTSDTCETCIETGCNFRPASRPAELKCVMCYHNPICSWGFADPNLFVNQCEEDVWMGEVEGCYTGRSLFSTVTRGCSLSTHYPCSSDYECNHCHTDRCNAIAVEKQQCIHCRSDIPGQESCADSAQGLPFKECSGDYQEYLQRGCYTMRQPDGVVIRGCKRDLSYEDFYWNCSDGCNDFCITCSDNACNNRRAPSNANVSRSIYMMIIILTLMTICRYVNN